MGIITKIRRSTMVVVIIVSGIFLFIKCNNDPGYKTEAGYSDNFKEFAGSATCVSCHKDIYDAHQLTEHYHSSATATEKNIAGSFEKGKNIYVVDQITSVIMEKRDSGFYQVEYLNGKEEKKGRFDIVIGSGRKGQSYLSWAGSRLVQMPITFFTPANNWSNSPGFPVDRVRYNRPITSRCLECHATYAQKISAPQVEPEQFDHNAIIFGVDCEKCHGPAAKHVQFQSQNPQVKEAKFIVNPARLSRQQNIDLCALCHGGRLNKTRPSFQFQAGDTLADFFSISNNPLDAANIDVHGNQFGLLSSSKCFALSQMTCTNCHNTHENEKDKIVLFSQKCIACHSGGHGKVCKMAASIGPAITQNCIDCHMPKQPSRSIAVNLHGSDIPTPVLMRTHLIKIYPEETGRVLKLLEKIMTSKKPIAGAKK